MEELFNLRHAQLRNVIERIFGVMKKRFQILVTMRDYEYATQVEIVYACIALHNFLAKHSGEDVIYVEWDEEFKVGQQQAHRLRATRRRDGNVEVHSDEEELTTNVSQEQRERGQENRERIASRMWRAYVRQTAATKTAERQRLAAGGVE
jgi:DDE superfamily endonuclease